MRAPQSRPKRKRKRGPKKIASSKLLEQWDQLRFRLATTMQRAKSLMPLALRRRGRKRGKRMRPILTAISGSGPFSALR